MSRLKILIGVFLVIVIAFLPVIVFAKDFDSFNVTDPGDPYYGTKLSINKAIVSINQTVRVKLSLRLGSEKAPDKATTLTIEKKTVKLTGGPYPVIISATTNPSGKAVLKFKIRDFDPEAKKGDTYSLTVSLADGKKVGSTTVTLR